MPAESQAERAYLNARFGHAWVKRHHFDNKGPLPEHVEHDAQGGVAKNMSKAHPGFKSVQGSIASKEGISRKAAGAILAASTRHASAKAKRANPRLKRVKMSHGGVSGQYGEQYGGATERRTHD